MTEAEWLAYEKPKQMLGFNPAQWTDRKSRLFACGCARITDWFMRLAGSDLAVEAAERWADGSNGSGVWGLAGSMIASAAADHPNRQHFSYGNVLFGLSHQTPRIAAAYTLAWFCGHGDHAPSGAGKKVACDLIRDIFGNPFRPISFAPEWLTSTAIAIAQGMYESRDFSAMPILADALQDAECEDEAILKHCRDEKQVHVRGCWVVDLVLGKE